MPELRAYRPPAPRRAVRRADSSRGYGKLVVSIVILAAITYAALQILPPYIHNYELRDYASDLVLESAANRIRPDEIPAELAGRATELNLPIEAQDVAVSSEAGQVRVSVHYTVPVNFRVYVWPMRLKVSASAPRLAY